MSNFWDSNVWGAFNLIAVLLSSLLAASLLKKAIKLLKDSLIPTSVVGGGILLAIAAIYKFITKTKLVRTRTSHLFQKRKNGREFQLIFKVHVAIFHKKIFCVFIFFHSIISIQLSCKKVNPSTRFFTEKS